MAASPDKTPNPATRRRSAKLRVTLSRNDVWLLKDGLESVIEDFKYDGGLNLAEEYVELENRLGEWLTEFDREGRRKVG